MNITHNGVICSFLFFFNDTATTEIYTSVNTLSLHDALPISGTPVVEGAHGVHRLRLGEPADELGDPLVLRRFGALLARREQRERGDHGGEGDAPCRADPEDDRVRSHEPAHDAARAGWRRATELRHHPRF